MDRLTGRIKNGVVSAIYDEDFVFRMDDETYSGYLKLIERLAAYEDTGLTPEEITAMKADNERLHKLVDTVQTLLWGDTEKKER